MSIASQAKLGLVIRIIRTAAVEANAIMFRRHRECKSERRATLMLLRFVSGLRYVTISYDAGADFRHLKGLGITARKTLGC